VIEGIAESRMDCLELADLVLGRFRSLVVKVEEVQA
jgi:hypothetical protein